MYNMNSQINSKRYSAGILPYSIHNGVVYYLLGRDTREDCWSDFGGKCEAKDGNNTTITACREFYEETAGSVLSYEHSLYTLMNDSSNTHIIQSTTLNGSPYYMYLMHIPYMNYKQTFYRTIDLLKYIDYSNAKFREKNDIRWIEHNALVNGNGTIKFRAIFKKTIREGYSKLSGIQPNNAENIHNEIR